MLKKCVICNKSIIITSDQKLCNICKIKKCIICGKKFSTYLSRIKTGKTRCCSMACENKRRKGKHHSPTTEFKKGHIPANFKGKTKHGDGYIMIYCPNHPFASVRKVVLEHRLVVESQIDRYLLPKEQVHHLGKKDDNRPHMLMAFKSFSSHRLFENGKYIPPEAIIFDGRKL